jgi:hypothetical protein
LFHEDQDRIYYANPYHHECKDTDLLNVQKKKEKASFHRLIEPYIDNETNSFFSKVFFIRYAEELVVLRDIIKFRTEVEVKPGYLETEFFLKVELFYQAPPVINFTRCMNSPMEMQNTLQTNGE